MNGHFRWCGWCCNLRYPLCCACALCSDCCRCPPPRLPDFCPPEPLPQMPPLGPPPPPIRIIREHVIVPVPYPVYPNRGSCLPRCWVEEPQDICSARPQTPLLRGGYKRSLPLRCFPPPENNYGCDPCGRPFKPDPCDPCGRPCGDGGVIEISHPCPWPKGRLKRIYQQGQAIMPGYKGHVPGMRFHAAGRSYGQATRDTCCIMSQWGECCPDLPCRIFEQ